MKKNYNWWSIHYKIGALLLSFFVPFVTDGAETFTKEATFYSDYFDGRRTADGDTFDQTGYSAAICSMPLGQYLYVSKGGTGIVVDANDRPNCNSHPQVIDLSREAFRIFAPFSVGRISDVSVTTLGPSPTDRVKWFLPRNAFEHLGITLTSDIPTVLLAWEGREIQGKVLNSNKFVLFYVNTWEDDESVSFLAPVSTDKSFRWFLRFPEKIGDAVLVIASGNSFDTDRYSTVSLIDDRNLSYPTLPESKYRLTPRIVTIEWSDPSIRLPAGIYGNMRITQWSKTTLSRWNTFILSDLPFSRGDARVHISGYRISTPSWLDRSTIIPSLFSGSVFLDRVHDSIGADNISIQQRWAIANFRFKTPMDSRIRGKYYLTLPSGGVKELSFSSSLITTDGYLKKWIFVKESVTLDRDGVYMLEIVREDWVAHVNKPIIKWVVWPILPALRDDEMTTIRREKQEVIASTYTKINLVRKNIGRTALILDQDLTKIAEAKVADMIKRGYQWHADPDGNYVDTIAERIGIDTGWSIGENIGFGTVSDLALQDGLEESGVHRMNMQSPEWTRVGIGYGVSGKKVYLVNIFWE
jgi:uncharacterized protein YkwD